MRLLVPCLLAVLSRRVSKSRARSSSFSLGQLSSRAIWEHFNAVSLRRVGPSLSHPKKGANSIRRCAVLRDI
ncbi:hypothetical protein BC939DRAFT_443802, partial [Gamsiella multidivaricata]|uniref:uncharacterized protein n=1 Tax=Gamsiella multidivaricata TaxID=101098 RepID=UPI002220BDAE